MAAISDFVWFWAFGGVLLVGVGVGELLQARGWPGEATRRFVHAWTGLAVAGCPLLFDDPFWIYVLATGFIGVNLWAIPRGVFRGMHAIERQSLGTVVFPTALLVSLWACWTLDATRAFALQTAFLVLALADPAASLVGESLRRPGRFSVGGNTKSLAGTAAFFVTATLLAWSALVWLDPFAFTPAEYAAAALLVAVLATGAELIGGKGWDNLTIVVAVIVPLVFLREAPGELVSLAVALGWALAFGVLAYGARFLDLGGAIAASLLAFSVVGLGGWDWALPGFAFFVLSSLLSKLGKRRKSAVVQAEKGSRRDAGQVYANGGVAWLLLLVHVVAPQPWLYWGFVGAFAAAAADTWATEIGTWVRGATRSVWTWKPVAPGASGGVSIAGTLGALAGAATVFAPLPFVATARLAEVGTGTAFAVVVLGGVLASLLDSALGATAQALYRDVRTRALTERAATGFDDDRVPNPLVRGWAWVTNDRVNLAGTLAGAALVAVASLFL
ncbi:MAG: DUF92 domain-containing protein [Bacteroidota bacterium]